MLLRNSLAGLGRLELYVTHCTVRRCFLSRPYVDLTMQTIRTVKPLKAAIITLAYPHSPTYFSFLHILFIRMCLDAKCFRDAISILDHDIEAFTHASEKEITYKDQLTYHYYGATIYIAAKRWNRAAAFLTFVITCPGNATSNIQVEAAKRLVFVNLLMDGKVLIASTHSHTHTHIYIYQSCPSMERA